MLNFVFLDLNETPALNLVTPAILVALKSIPKRLLPPNFCVKLALKFNGGLYLFIKNNFV